MTAINQQKDILLWATTGSILIHLLIILGVVFISPQSAQEKPTPPIKIILTDAPESEPNDDAKILAQKNNRGGDEQIKQSLPSFVSTPRSEQAINDPTDKTLTTVNNHSNQYNKPIKEQLKNELQQILVQSSRQLNWQEKYITANTKENKFAEYIERWRLMVERIGNLNYPEAAKQQQLEGELVLDVIINKDGSLDGIQVLKSSGIKILDDAAKRIVDIAAPFDRFPNTFKNETDRLHIIRTWIFSNNRLLSDEVENNQN